MSKKILTLYFFQALFFSSFAQKTRLDVYIAEGLTNSHTLKQEQFQLEKNLIALEDAKALHKANVNFSTTYTIGYGGRSIDFPLGDLFNPIYSALKINKTLENQKVVLNPYNFYDAKFRTTYPIVNAEIKLNERAKAEMIPFKQAEINVYKRELVKDIKTAYFRYLQATQAIGIFENAIKLLNDLKRVNQSLVNNGVGLPSLLVRSNSEIIKIEAQKTEAQYNQKSAAAYFNFLTGKKSDEKIEIDTIYWSNNQHFVKELKADTKNREELQKLQSATRLSEVALDFQKAYFKPTLGAFIDLGSQGYLIKNSPSLYVFGGVQFDFPIYDGKRDKKRIEMAQKDIASLNEQSENVENQLELQLNVALNAYLSALNTYESTNAQITLNKRYYSDLLKRYKEGTALFIELNDAQTQLLIAELQQSIALSTVWIKLADLERVSAGYNF
jgi:outer membrane protein TolC